MKKITTIIAIASLSVITSCSRDYLDTNPADQVSDTQLATSPSGLKAALSGVYLQLASSGAGGSTNHDDFGIMSEKISTDLMSNDMVQRTNHWFGAFYSFNAGVTTNSRTNVIWRTNYNAIYALNNIIISINKAGVNDNNKAFLGQALALRAYCYLNLARFYSFTYIGHENDLCVPIVDGLGDITEGKTRAKVTEVYASIVSDLKQAIINLNGINVDQPKEIGVKVAKGILADTYLEMGQYAQAATLAQEAREGYSLMGKDAYTTDGFSSINTNPEVMWGFDINNETTGIYASFFSHMGSVNSGYAGALGIYKCIDKRLYDKIPATDYRKQNFNGASAADYTWQGETKNYPGYTNFKFKDKTNFEGDYIYMRSSLMYYIQAEALAKSGNEAQAKQVLFEITKSRDAAYTLSTNSGQALLNEIDTQKRIEMWGEGYAWFDQKRLKQPLIRNYPGSNHAAFGKLDQEVNNLRWRLQIPLSEIQNNPNIGAQNPY